VSGELGNVLLPVPFTTIFEYLFLLREVCCAVSAAGADAMIFLAAAVSDFFVPEGEMATEKIQSRSCDGLSVQLRNVPKLLGHVKLWAPEAFVVSFKLETNRNILLAKAAGALQKYKMDAVCSNQLQTIRDLVTVVRRDPAAPAIRIGAGAGADGTIAGDEAQEIPAEGLVARRVERGGHSSIDVPLVEVVVDMHSEHISARAAGTEDPPPPAKRPRA